MVKVDFSLILLTLVFLLGNFVSGERDADGGLEIPPENPHPRQHKEPGRNWESWTSPEGTLWYPGRIDYRIRQPQTGNGAGASPSGSDTYDASTRRYFSFDEGPQFLSEHRLSNSAHSQYGKGGVEGGVDSRGRDQGWYPYDGQYEPGEESHSPDGSNGQYPVDRRDSYGSYSSERHTGNVPYGQYFLNGQRVPDAGDPLHPKPNGGGYVPDTRRSQHIPGQEGQGGEYVPGETGQFIPGLDQHYQPGNRDYDGINPDGHYIHPDYGALPNPRGEQNGHFLPENDPDIYYDGRDDYYPDSQYPYYYVDGQDYDQTGIDGGEHGVYIPPERQYDPNMFYEHGQQAGRELDSHITAGQYDKHSPEQVTGHPPNPDPNNVIFAGRDFLSVPTARRNSTSGQHSVFQSLTKHGAEENRELPSLIHRGAGIDSSRTAQNQSSSGSRGYRREYDVHSERAEGFDRRIPEGTRTARPTERQPNTTPKQPLTTASSTTITTPTTPTTSTTIRYTRVTTRSTTRTTPTTTTRPPVNTIPPYSYNQRRGRPVHYPTMEHQRGRGTNSHTDTRSGMRPGYDETLNSRRPHQRPTISTVEIDLSKLMPEEEIHGPADTGRRVNSFLHPQNPFPSGAEQRSTRSPIDATEDVRRHPHRERSEAHGTDTPSRRGHDTGGQQLYPRREQQSREQHSSQTGSTGSGVGTYDRQRLRHDIIRQGQQRTRHEGGDQSRVHRTGQHRPETSRYDHEARTDQWSGRRHQATPDRREYGSSIDENTSYDYAAGRDRTHSQGHRQVDSRRPSPPRTKTRRLILDPSIDSTHDRDTNREGLPGISLRGTCPSVSQCRCCRWSTQQTRKTMECLQPKFKTVEVQVCTEEYNGVCVRTGRRTTLKPNGTEVRMCSKVQLKRSCFVCCPTYYPRGHNQTCNGVLDGIDKRGLRISVEADIGGFYQPPRISKGTDHSQEGRHEFPRDEASRQSGQAAYRAHTSIMAEPERGMMADQTPNVRPICIIQTTGARGNIITEKRPCSSLVKRTTTSQERNTTGACCLTREQFQNLFLRYCCNTKRYNGREYSQRLCCGSNDAERPDRERVRSLAKDPDFDATSRSNAERTRAVVESTRLRVGRVSLPEMNSKSQTSMQTRVSQMMEESEDANFERPIESDVEQTRNVFQTSGRVENPASPSMRMRSSLGSVRRTQRQETAVARAAEEPLDTRTQKSFDTIRHRKCCPPRTGLRTMASREESDQLQETLFSSRDKSRRRENGDSRWSRVYSCCSNGNYLRKVACCLKRSTVTPLCCRKVSSLRS